jgi:hypothetical protein
MCRSLQVAWTFIILLAACRRHSLQVPPTGDVSNPVARSAAPADAGDRSMRGGDAASDDNLPDLIEIVGTAPQLMKLPAVGKLNISDHGQTPLARGRWKVFAYVAVKNTPGVLKEIDPRLRGFHAHALALANRSSDGVRSSGDVIASDPHPRHGGVQ